MNAAAAAAAAAAAVLLLLHSAAADEPLKPPRYGVMPTASWRRRPQTLARTRVRAVTHRGRTHSWKNTALTSRGLRVPPRHEARQKPQTRPRQSDDPNESDQAESFRWNCFIIWNKSSAAAVPLAVFLPAVNTVTQTDESLLSSSKQFVKTLFFCCSNLSKGLRQTGLHGRVSSWKQKKLQTQTTTLVAVVRCEKAEVLILATCGERSHRDEPGQKEAHTCDRTVINPPRIDRESDRNRLRTLQPGDMLSTLRLFCCVSTTPLFSVDGQRRARSCRTVCRNTEAEAEAEAEMLFGI
ncbi:uncharacterized protein V6R79_004149 [Siganus canaliculatus]